MSGRWVGDTGPVIFNIDAALSYEGAVTVNDEAAFSAGFRPDDESVCVWIAENRPTVLRISFDIEAGEYAYEDALNSALSELRSIEFADGLTGKPVELVAMTQDGLARWTE
jgi:hypothetical protein